jgi:hypothetical protein
MTQSKLPPTPKQKSILALLLLLVLLAAGAAFLILRQPKASDLPPLVSILSPGTGNLAEINVPLGIQVLAEDFPGVRRVELYADGLLVAVQESDLVQGGNPLILDQSWTPLSLGRHALVARGYDLGGKIGDSGVVFVDVVELVTATRLVNIDSIQHADSITTPSLAQIADAGAGPLGNLVDLNPSLDVSNLNAPLPPGTILTIPRNPAPAPSDTGSGQPAPAPLPGTPAFPANLSGTIDCSTARLQWTNSPEAEQGYAVYRIAPADPSPVRVATPARGTTSDSEPVSGSGTYRYQVAALRNGMEGAGEYITLTIPDSCGSSASNPTVISLIFNVTGLTTRQVFDGVYCYFSFDQGATRRVPGDDFSSLLPGGGGLSYDLQAQLQNRGLFLLSAHPAGQPVTVGGECWGRLGVESHDLGAVSISVPPANWDGSQHQAVVRQSTRVASAGNAPMTSDSFTITYRIGQDSTDVLQSFARPEFGALPPEELRPVILPDMIFPDPYDLFANFGSSPARCSPSETGVVCTAPQGVRLAWMWNGNFDSLGHFGYVIDGLISGTVAAVENRVTVDNGALAQLLALHCGSGNMIGYDINVYDKNGQMRSGAHSEFPAPQCNTQVANVEVTLDSLAIGPSSDHHAILDNDLCILCTDSRIEMNASARLIPGSYEWDGMVWRGREFWDDTYTYIAVFFIPYTLYDSLFGDPCGMDFAACAQGPSATTSLQWADQTLQSTNGTIATNNNTMRVQFHDGHTVTLEINVKDYPNGAGTTTIDPLCVETVTFPWRTALEWQNVSEQHTITQDHGEASCQLTYTIRGSIP